jgi:hypothetical protein
LTVPRAQSSQPIGAGSGGGIFNEGPLEVTNSTFSGNSASQDAGGIFNIVNLGSATLKNTIVANSASGGDCSGTIDGGYNLVEDGSCISAPTSLSGDPDLGTLRDNGGPTMTHALLAGSPAIDKGKAFGETTDQRGRPRPSNFPTIANASGGDGSDIGAFEKQFVDTKAPRVTSTVPAPGTKRVFAGANIKATFSEDMKPNSINGQTFKLFKKGSTTKVGATVSYNPNKEMALLNPNNSLKSGATYKAVVTTAARDEADNRLDQKPGVSGLQSKVWFFTVRN